MHFESSCPSLSSALKAGCILHLAPILLSFAFVRSDFEMRSLCVGKKGFKKKKKRIFRYGLSLIWPSFNIQNRSPISFSSFLIFPELFFFF
jgi:hypothetical protein